MNLTAKLGIDVSDFTAGLKQAETQSDKSFSAIVKEFNKVQREAKRTLANATTPFEKAMARLGDKATGEQIIQLKLAYDEAQFAKGVANAERQIEALKQELSEYGKSATEIQRMRIVRQGATEAQLREFDALSKKKDALIAERNELDKSNNALSQRANVLNSLKGLIVGAFAVGGVRGVVEMTDAYSQMTARLRNVVSGTEELSYVQQRLAENTKSTYRSISEATTSYINLSGSLKAIGYTTKEVLDFNDSLTYAFTASGTSTDRAEQALNALNRAFAQGKLDSESWRSVLIAVPSMAKDIANSLGIAEDEVRKLGATGSLGLDDFTQAVIKNRDSNLELADSMSASVRDGYTYFKNALSAYLGTANDAYSITATLASGLKMLGDNVGLLVKAMTAFIALKAYQQFKLITGAIIAKTASIVGSTKAVVAETVAISANTKALMANATARSVVGKMGAIGGATMAGVGGMLGGGAITGFVATALAGLGSAVEAVQVAIGKKSETVASGIADGIVKMVTGGSSLSLGDLLYQNINRDGIVSKLNAQKQTASEFTEIKLSPELKELRSAVTALGAELNKQTESIAKTDISEQLKNAYLKLKEIQTGGADDPSKVAEQLDKIDKLYAENQKLIDKQATDYIDNLKAQAEAVGKTSEEMDVLRLASKGVSGALIEQAKEQQILVETLKNQDALRKKLADMQSEYNKIGKSERDLFIEEVRKLGAGDKGLVDAIIKQYDANNAMKQVAELQKQSTEEFSLAVDKFKDDGSGQGYYDKLFAMLDKMSYLEQQEFWKQQQLNQVGYNSIRPIDNAPQYQVEQMGGLTIYLTNDKEKVAGEITGTKEFMQKFKSYFEQSVNDIAYAY